jgi:hypothetical protein
MNILWNDPSNTSQLLLYPSLLYIRELLLDLIRKSETDNRQTFEVVLCILLVEWRMARCDGFGSRIDRVESAGGLGFVDLGKDCEIARILEGSGDHSSFSQIILHDSPVPIETEVEDWTVSCILETSRRSFLTVEHLTENGVSRSREVEIERVVGLSSVHDLSGLG